MTTPTSNLDGMLDEQVQTRLSTAKRSRPHLSIFTHSASSSISSTTSSASESSAKEGAHGGYVTLDSIDLTNVLTTEPETLPDTAEGSSLIKHAEHGSFGNLPKLSKSLVSINPMLGSRAKELQEKITKLRRHTASMSKLG